MMSITIDDKKFFKELSNITKYSEGFLQGVEMGKQKFSESIAKNGIEIFKDFVDQNARVDEQMYHHIYEWYQSGVPSARLFDIEYSISNGGISLNGTFSQSRSVSNGSRTPFYNKAQIMERGIPVTISPVNASVLSFDIGGEQVFTAGPITVSNPGGTHVMGSFERIFDNFFRNHFKQSVLDLTGITKYLENAKPFKENLKAAKSGGKATGVQVGYNWITKAGDLSV